MTKNIASKEVLATQKQTFADSATIGPAENLQKRKLKKFVRVRGGQPKRNAKRGRELVDGSVQLINQRKRSINIQIVQTKRGRIKHQN